MSKLIDLIVMALTHFLTEEAFSQWRVARDPLLGKKERSDHLMSNALFPVGKVVAGQIVLFKSCRIDYPSTSYGKT